jgi:chemotaxis protein MotB
VSGQGGTKVIIIKKKGKHGGHHGGAWKVAYADFVTAMMAFFMVMWLLTQSDERSKERIAQYFRTGMLPGGTLTFGTPAGSNPPVAINIFPSGSVGGPRTGTPDKQVTMQVDEMIKSLEGDPALKGLAEHLKVTNTPEGTLIELVDDADNYLFPVGSAGLKPQAVSLLEKLAPIFARMKNKLEIHGHTDGRKFDSGSRKSNWALSFERANEARRVLEASGVQAGKISGVQAHADAEPITKPDPLAPENRRLALLILKDKTKKAKKPRAPSAEGETGASDTGNPFDPPDAPAPTHEAEP